VPFGDPLGLSDEGPSFFLIGDLGSIEYNFETQNTCVYAG